MTDLGALQACLSAELTVNLGRKTFALTDGTRIYRPRVSSGRAHPCDVRALVLRLRLQAFRQPSSGAPVIAALLLPQLTAPAALEFQQGFAGARPSAPTSRSGRRSCGSTSRSAFLRCPPTIRPRCCCGPASPSGSLARTARRRPPSATHPCSRQAPTCHPSPAGPHPTRRTGARRRQPRTGRASGHQPGGCRA